MAKANQDNVSIIYEGVDIPLTIKRNARAKHVSVRIDVSDRAAVLVLPPRASVKRGLEFASSHADWIQERLADLPPAKLFQAGEVIEVAGEALTICHHRDARRGVWRDGDQLNVSGPEDVISARVTRWLKTEARNQMLAQVEKHCAAMGRKAAPVRVREMKSRWGSCTREGRLTFSWRLVLAPDFVIDYLAAHECAHLVHMNHGPNFWALVKKLTPHEKRARAWLDGEGRSLHAWAASSS